MLLPLEPTTPSPPAALPPEPALFVDEMELALCPHATKGQANATKRAATATENLTDEEGGLG